MLEFVLGAVTATGPDGVVIAGEQLGVAAGDAALLAREAGARFAYVTRRAGDRGSLRAGVHPALLPGGRRFDDPDARAEVEAVWGPIMSAEPGRDAGGILHACAEGQIDVLFVIGADPLRDHPDAALARRALENVPTVVVQGLELGGLAPFASAFLPALPVIERDGHLTTWEGRGQRVRPVRPGRGARAARLGDLREPRARDGRRPRRRDARGAARGDGAAPRAARGRARARRPRSTRR